MPERPPAKRENGPTFAVRTWRDGDGWHASLVPFVRGAEPTTGMSESRRCVGHGRRLLETAVRDAVAHYLRTWGSET